jgi:tetratricopeptide (TPR) repeat protein
MVKRYHPDRHRGPTLKDLRGHLEQIFWKITNGYKVLSNPVARRRYDNSLRTEAPRGENLAPRVAKPKPTPEDDASLVFKERGENYYQQARRAFTQGDYHKTVALMEEAVRLDPSRADYHGLIAQAMAKNPKWRKDAEEHFQAALKINPFDIDCLVGLGEIYEAAGMTTRASKLYSEALGQDPNNEKLKRKLSSGKKSWWVH